MLQEHLDEGFTVLVDSQVQGCRATLHAPVGNEKMGVRGTGGEGDGWVGQVVGGGCGIGLRVRVSGGCGSVIVVSDWVKCLSGLASSNPRPHPR